MAIIFKGFDKWWRFEVYVYIYIYIYNDQERSISRDTTLKRNGKLRKLHLILISYNE